MDLDDERSGQREFRNKTYLIADVEPLDVDGVRAVQIGSALFLLAFVGLLPFYGRLEQDDHTWWLWTCLAGFGLGLLGLEYCKRHRRMRREGRERREGQAASQAASPPDGQPGAEPGD
ncbi:hypothetical protein GCM10027020_05260 [Nocardioides salsibiostraticola]